MYTNFENILKEKGLKTADVVKGTGIAASTFSEWKNGNHVPSAKKIKAIAEFLNVPESAIISGKTDFVVTGADGEPIIIDVETSDLLREMRLNTYLQRLVTNARKLNPEQQEAIANLIEGLFFTSI